MTDFEKYVPALIIALVIIALVAVIYYFNKGKTPEGDAMSGAPEIDVVPMPGKEKMHIKAKEDMHIKAKEDFANAPSFYGATGEFADVRDPVEATWQTRARDMNVDPEVFSSHQRFTNDTSVYSRGAARTSLVSDYRTEGLTNFTGLYRPVRVPARKGIRTQSSEDEASFDAARKFVF